MITAGELRKIMPHAGARIDVYLAPLNAAMLEFGIDNPLREAAFLAQIAHESGELRYVSELASGEAYEGRLDLGNNEPGEGVYTKGAGLIQATGDSNWQDAGVALHGDRDWYRYNRALMLQPVDACRVSAWFWKSHGLNELADKGDFLRITKVINGGTTHYKERLAYYEVAKGVYA